MKYWLILIALTGAIVTQSVYAQEKSNYAGISKAIGKHGKAFLNNTNITSVSIGVLKDGENYTQHFGEVEKGKDVPPDDGSIYEIGSVTKTMTGYLVAEAVLNGKIKLDADVRLYLNEDYPNLNYNGQPVTIRHLLTHTSGLPISLPAELNKVFEKLDNNVPNEYHEIEKTYGKDNFLSDLRNVSLTVEPGIKYSYSNAGAELLGYVLETIYGKSLDALLKERFLNKCDMPNTAIELDQTQKAKLVGGYWMDNATPSPSQLNKLWATASGVKMNMADMMHYIRLQLTTEDPVTAESHKVLYEEGKLLKVGYFWRIWNDKHGRSYNHHGGTSGTQNWLFIFPKYKLGISIITNQSGPKTPNLLSKTVKRILEDIVE